MKTSPIQLKEITFRRVSVELDAARIPEDGSPPSDVSFDFDNVTISTHTSFSLAEEANEPGASYFLVLRVLIENKESKDKQLRYSPYLMDIEAGAVVRALPGSEVLGDIEDLVVINGTSLLWSAIREQVCTLTARMPAGLVMLPTVNFQDLRKDQQKKAGDPTPQPRKRKVPKKAASGESGT